VTETAQAIAADILRSYETGVPIAPVRSRLPDGDVAAAYAVQQACAAHWLKQGRRKVGHKIGLTAKAVQKQLGVDQPDFGVLFADMALGDGEPIASGRGLQPRAEAEIAFVLGRDLALAQPTPADVMRATEFVVPAIEVVGSRIANWDIKIVDTVADNASSALFVLGGPPRKLDGLDLVGCAMTMTRGGETVSSGKGAACLGNPVNAVVWLARKMAALGEPLRAGDVVMSGALGPMAAAKPGDAFEATIQGLGSVRALFDA
jgi:2-keto-4-pentenoate hydratase